MGLRFPIAIIGEPISVSRITLKRLAICLPI